MNDTWCQLRIKRNLLFARPSFSTSQRPWLLVSIVRKDNREFDSAPHSQGTPCSWEAWPRWKIQDCPLFALKRIQRKEMKAWDQRGWHGGHSTPGQALMKKSHIPPERRGLDRVIMLSKLALDLFITRWVYLPRGKLRGGFSGHFITPDPVLPSTR